MDTTRIARLIIANTACFLAFWIARLAVPWWFGVAALILLNISLPHRNQRLFRLYHGLETCFIIVYLALTADRHTLQEFLAILLLTVLFELFFWLVGNLTLAAESPAHFLRISILACCYSVLGNTDPVMATVVLAIMLAASMLSAVTASDPRAVRRLLPGFIILLVVFVAAVASPIVQAPALPRAAVWLLPGTPASTPKPAGGGGLPVNLPALTLRRVIEEHFWELFGFIYLPLAIMTAVLIAAAIVSVSVLHNTWGKTVRVLIFPFAVVVTALIFTIIYTGAKTGQIANGIAQAGWFSSEDYNAIIDALRGRNILPAKNDEMKATLETMVAAVYWLGASLLLVSIVASIRDMIFEFRHEVLLSMLDRSQRKKVIRAIRRLVSLDEGALIADPVASITALFAVGVEAVGAIGPRLRRGETAGEFAQRVTVEAPACASTMSQLAALFGKARYSRSSVTGEDVIVAKTALQNLRACVRSTRNEARTSRRPARGR
ncbi:MAG: DUF4129 domain-containing protein [Caldiserica bacterium]|nr:DUF4129 domain-containing protein [Caldisericota bacterium]